MEALAALVAAHGEHPPLDEALLAMARTERPELPRSAVFEPLDRMGERASRLVSAADGGLEALRTVLFDLEGFSGAREDYHAPENSCLDQVLERRVGIPISLSAVWLEVARRAGTLAAGVGFPGHFLVRHRAGATETYVDVYGGGHALDLPKLQALLSSVRGPKAEVHPDMLASVSARTVLLRVATNLKNAYALRRDPQGLLRSMDRLVSIAPDRPEERRDRGLLRARLGLPGPALTDLETYLEQGEPEPDEAAAILVLLPELRRQGALTN